MEIRTIINLSELYFKKLEQFVSSHPNGNFFQSPKAFQFFQAVENYQPFLFVAMENDDIVGSLLAVIMKEGTGLKGYFSRRCIIWGAPLAKDQNSAIHSSIFKKLNEIVSKKSIYSEIRNFSDQSVQKELLQQIGFRFNEHLNYIVKISSLEEAWTKLSDSKKRQIKKSIKNGASIIEAEKLDQIESFYKILATLYREKVKKPLPSFELFEKFFRCDELGKYFLIAYQDKIIGGIMCPIYQDTIYEWFVCGLDGEFQNIYPSVLATWAPIEYAAKHGLKYFDFMGAGKPDEDYGVREFKSKFGGELVNYGRFVRINNPLLYNIGKIGLKIWGKIC